MFDNIQLSRVQSLPVLKNHENSSTVFTLIFSASEHEKSAYLRAFRAWHLFHANNVAGAEGFEPSARGFGDRCSTNWAIPLDKKMWWTIRDSNPGPTGYEPVALTNWANGPHRAKKIASFLRSLHNDLTQARGNIGDPWENRTPDAGVRGRSLNRLTNGPYNAELQHIKKNRSEQKYICPLREIWCTIGDSNPGPTD